MYAYISRSNIWKRIFQDYFKLSWNMADYPIRRTFGKDFPYMILQNLIKLFLLKLNNRHIFVKSLLFFFILITKIDFQNFVYLRLNFVLT